MKNSVFFNFIFLLLVKHKSKHFAIFLISIFIVFLTSSILFIKNSLQKEISDALENQSDFIIQKTVANKIKDIEIPVPNIELQNKLAQNFPEYVDPVSHKDAESPLRTD